jgi:hypothetical protein
VVRRQACRTTRCWIERGVRAEKDLKKKSVVGGREEKREIAPKKALRIWSPSTRVNKPKRRRAPPSRRDVVGTAGLAVLSLA